MKLDHKGNRIHETAVVETKNIGINNYIGPFCYISERVYIGDNNVFQGHCSIGTPPEHRAHWNDGKQYGVIIGDKCRFNEFVTVNCGYERDTLIQDGCYFLRGAHVGHDVIVNPSVRCHCNTILAGYVEVGSNSYIGLGAIINPKIKIGMNSLVGAGAVVLKDVPPGIKVAGVPARYIGDNEI